MRSVTGSIGARWAATGGVVAMLVGGGVWGWGRGTVARGEVPPFSLRLSHLTGQDRAVLEFTTDGCFHHRAYRIEYAPVPTPRLTVTDLEPRNTKTLRPEDPRQLGTVTLTPAQVQRLDETLRYFREYNGKGGCTTSDTLTVTAYHDGKQSARETSKDRTCGRDVLEDADPQDLQTLSRQTTGRRRYPRFTPVLSLSTVIKLAYNAHEKGLATVAYVEPPRTKTQAYITVQRERKEVAEQQHAEELVRTLPGYATIRQQFRVTKTLIGSINSFPYSLGTQLTATHPRLVDEGWWFNPIENGKPLYDWNQLLQIHQNVEKTVARHRWVSQWKKAGPGRTVELSFCGKLMIDAFNPEWEVYPAWKSAGLRGMPQTQIQLCRPDRTQITVYFGNQETRALITEAEPPQSEKLRFWLDSVRLSYSAQDTVPQYGTVTPDGTWRRNVRRDPKTAAWFKKEYATWLKKSQTQ